MPDTLTPQTDADGNLTYEYSSVDGDVTSTIIFDENFEIIGEGIEDTNLGLDFSETVVVSDDGLTYTVAGTNTTAQTERTYSFVYDTSDDSFVSGTETIDGVTYNYAEDGSVTQSISVSSGVVLGSSELDKLPDSLVAETGDTYAVVDGNETTYIDDTGSIFRL